MRLGLPQYEVLVGSAHHKRFARSVLLQAIVFRFIFYDFSLLDAVVQLAQLKFNFRLAVVGFYGRRYGVIGEALVQRANVVGIEAIVAHKSTGGRLFASRVYLLLFGLVVADEAVSLHVDERIVHELGLVLLKHVLRGRHCLVDANRRAQH